MTEDLAEQPSIPILSKPVSLMQAGMTAGSGGGLLNANHLATAAAAKHPVAHLEQQQQQQTASSSVGPHFDLNHVRHMYGSALAMRLATERHIAMQQQQQRPMSHGGGCLYGEICSGQDVQLHWEDYLSVPEYQPDVVGVSSINNPHGVMERQLNMM